MQLDLYHSESCPFSAMVRDFIEEKGLRSKINYHEVDDEPGAARRLNEITGGDQVPCLVIDGKPLLESKDIITWLAKNMVERRVA